MVFQLWALPFPCDPPLQNMASNAIWPRERLQSAPSWSGRQKPALPSSATTHLRGCRVAESLPVPRQWMRHHSAWLLQLPWGLWPDTPLGPHYVNNSIFSSNVDKNTGFFQQRLKARINIFTFFFSFFFFLLQSETFPLRIWKVNRQSLRNSDDSQLDSSKARLTKSRGRTGQKAEHRGKALLRGKELLWKQRELHPEN